MTPFEIGLMALGGMGVFVMAGMYVPIALILMSFVGVWAIKGSPLLAALLLLQFLARIARRYLRGAHDPV